MQYVFVIACRRSRLSVHAHRPHIQQAKCEHLALSSNNIEKVTGLKGLKSLKVLSLGRNLLKKFDGIEEVADSLEQLWLSYNLIEKMAGVEALTNLKTLYMSNNLVTKWAEVARLAGLPFLEELLLQGNPIYNDFIAVGTYRIQCAGRMNKLAKLDGAPVFAEERQLGIALDSSHADIYRLTLWHRCISA